MTELSSPTECPSARPSRSRTSALRPACESTSPSSIQPETWYALQLRSSISPLGPRTSTPPCRRRLRRNPSSPRPTCSVRSARGDPGLRARPLARRGASRRMAQAGRASFERGRLRGAPAQTRATAVRRLVFLTRAAASRSRPGHDGAADASRSVGRVERARRRSRRSARPCKHLLTQLRRRGPRSEASARACGAACNPRPR